jgi:hypothetical protein
MVTLRPTNLHWITGRADDPADTCAHSGVEFRVDHQVLVQASDGDWAVSAAALFLLRTLSRPHTKQSPVGDQLFPHCGMVICEVQGADAFVFCCDRGVDFEVLHVEGGIALTAPDGRCFSIAASEWREAVVGFSDAVQDFYVTSSPKQPTDTDDAKGFQQFLGEWRRRRSQADIVPLTPPTLRR